MKKGIIFVAFILGFKGNAQLTTHHMIFVGYQYQNQSFGEVGYRLLFLKKDDILYRISGSGLMGSVNSKFTIVPKIQADLLLNFNKNTNLQHGYYFLAGTEITPKYIAPKVGISALGIIDITAGYGFQLGNNTLNDKILKGINLNFTVNIPLVVFSKANEKNN